MILWNSSIVLWHAFVLRKICREQISVEFIVNFYGIPIGTWKSMQYVQIYSEKWFIFSNILLQSISLHWVVQILPPWFQLGDRNTSFQWITWFGVPSELVGTLDGSHLLDRGSKLGERAILHVINFHVEIFQTTECNSSIYPNGSFSSNIPFDNKRSSIRKYICTLNIRSPTQAHNEREKKKRLKKTKVWAEIKENWKFNSPSVEFNC